MAEHHQDFLGLITITFARTSGASQNRAARVASPLPAIGRVSTGAPSITPVPIRVPVTTISVVTTGRTIAVTFSIPISVPVVIVTVAFTTPVASTVRIASRPAMSHILSGSGSVGSVSNRVVDADTTAVQLLWRVGISVPRYVTEGELNDVQHRLVFRCNE